MHTPMIGDLHLSETVPLNRASKTLRPVLIGLLQDL
jgi:hypothetical protein